MSAAFLKVSQSLVPELKPALFGRMPGDGV